MSIWWANKAVIQIPTVDRVYFESTLIWGGPIGSDSVLLLTTLDELADPQDRLLLVGADFTPPDGLKLSGVL